MFCFRYQRTKCYIPYFQNFSLTSTPIIYTVEHKFHYFTNALGISKYGDIERPSIANILGTVVNRCYDVVSFSSYDDWCCNYGIERNIESKESFNTLVKDFKALTDVFGAKRLDELFDIVMYYA